MKFGTIFNNYVKENNLNATLIKEDASLNLYFENFLLEAKKAKADLFKDLSISNDDKITAEDVEAVKFYIKGKSAKDGKSPDELKKLNDKQAELFNKILQKVKEEAVGGKTTLISLTAAAIKIFAEDGQNKPTQSYNLRGVLTVLISKKKSLTPVDGTSVNASSVVVDPGDGTVDNLAGTAVPVSGDEEEATTPQTEPAEPESKFDSAIQQNKPTETTDSSNSYFKVDKNARVEKTEDPSREFRIAANYLLDTIKEELPGFFNKESLFSKVEEEQGGMSSEEVSTTVDKLVKLNKITLVPKGTDEEAVPDAEDEDEQTTTKSKYSVEDPQDITDRQLTGSTRKGFSSSDFNFDF